MLCLKNTYRQGDLNQPWEGGNIERAMGEGVLGVKRGIRLDFQNLKSLFKKYSAFVYQQTNKKPHQQNLFAC
jgi:hypothetical protein